MNDLNLGAELLLTPARRQAQELIAARLASGPRPLRLPARTRSSGRLLVPTLAFASLLMVSGAWAFLRRDRLPSPQTTQASTVPAQAALPGAPPHAAIPPSTLAGSTPAPASHAPRSRKRSRTVAAAVPARNPGVVDFDEPMGDVIYGRSPIVQPPLFTVKEYKERGVLVH